LISPTWPWALLVWQKFVSIV